MNKKSAFSLLELIFAIVIIGVIASVAIPKFMDTKADAEAATIKQDISTIVSSVRSYVMVGNTFSDFDSVLTLNKNTWTGSDTATIKFTDTEAECVTIAIADDKLTITVADAEAGTICEKLVALGVASTEYELN